MIGWKAAHLLKPSVDDIGPGQSNAHEFWAFGTFLQGGCAMWVRWDSDIGTVRCSLGDPPASHNYYSCSKDPSNAPIAIDVRDIAWSDHEMGFNVYVTRSTGTGRTIGTGQPPVQRGPEPGSSLLRIADLPGRGWRRAGPQAARALTGAFASIKLPRGCASGQKGTDGEPSRMFGWLFTRNRSGKEIVAATALRYARADQASRVQAASVSAALARCLARGMSAVKGIGASAQRLSIGATGDRSGAYRIVIHAHARRLTAYLDVMSFAKGRAAGVMGFYAERRQMTVGDEQAAANALAGRMRR